jgi:hypothetical protein
VRGKDPEAIYCYPGLVLIDERKWNFREWDYVLQFVLCRLSPKGIVIRWSSTDPANQQVCTAEEFYDRHAKKSG